MISSGTRKFAAIDSQCSKCQCVQLQPVVIPCTHRFCLNCIDETIRANSLNCPLCRLPFDSWIRLRNSSTQSISSVTSKRLSHTVTAATEKQQKLDESLWTSIKKRFNDLLIARSREEQSTSKSLASARLPLSKAFEMFGKNVDDYKKSLVMKPLTSVDARGGLNDSINREMTHFRPICLMPLSVRNTADKIVRVPPIKGNLSDSDASKTYKLMRTKFRQKLTSIHRKSAFSVIQTIEKKSAASTNQEVDVTPAIDSKNDKSERKSTSLAASQKRKRMPNSQPKQGRQQQQQEKQQQENVIDNSATTAKKPKIVQTVTKRGNATRDKMRLQEKEDFQLAKLLQEYDDNAHSPSTNRTVRYALRSRSKAPSSLSSSSSSIENFNNRVSTNLSQATTKKCWATEMNRKLGNGINEAAMLKFNEQKLTRSRRLALTITGA